MSDTTADPDRWRGPEPWFDRIARVLEVAVRLAVDVRVLRPDLLPRKGPVLVAANHVSKLDPPVIGVVVYRLRRRVRFLAVSGLFTVPVFGWMLRMTRMIPVHRGAGADRMVADARAALDADQAIIVYPEGTIPRPGEILPGRPGAGLLALAAASAGTPVVPMASWGLDHRGRRGLPRLRRRAVVAFGEPVDLSAWADRRDRVAQLEASATILAAVRSLSRHAERAGRRAGA